MAAARRTGEARGGDVSAAAASAAAAHILLVAADGTALPVSRQRLWRAAVGSRAELAAGAREIMLPRVCAQTLRLLVEFVHIGAPPESKTDGGEEEEEAGGEGSQSGGEEEETGWVRKRSIAEQHALFVAAEQLGVGRLRACVIEALAEVCAGATADELRRCFGIENDIDETEERILTEFRKAARASRPL